MELLITNSSAFIRAGRLTPIYEYDKTQRIQYEDFSTCAIYFLYVLVLNLWLELCDRRCCLQMLTVTVFVLAKRQAGVFL